MRTAFRRDAGCRGERNRRGLERIGAAASKDRRPAPMPDGRWPTAGAAIPESADLLAATRAAAPNARLRDPMARAEARGGGLPRR